MRHASPVLLILLLCACSPQRGADEGPTAAPAVAPAARPGPAAAPAADAPQDAPARWDGYANARLGSGHDAVRAAWAGGLAGDPIEPGECGYLVPDTAKNGAEFGLMFEDTRFVRYDVGTARDVAPGGGRVGMQRAQIEALYGGRVEVRPHEYVPGAQYLRITAPDAPERALVFETDEHGAITRWRVGQVPQVDYVEGCA